MMISLEILREILDIWSDPLISWKEYLQTTPYQFLTEYRVRKRTELLSEDLSISEVAGRCGYNQVSNYIAKFKFLMDCTPAQYRRRNH